MAMLTARPRRSFTPAFKAQTVELVRTSGKSVAEVCRELELTETAVRRWMAQAGIDAGRRDGLTTAEREELSRHRNSSPSCCCDDRLNSPSTPAPCTANCARPTTCARVSVGQAP